VTFGGVVADSFSVVGDTSIQAVAPEHAAGPVDVVVTTAGGSSAGGADSVFTYVPPPVAVVSALSPDMGAMAGGTTVTITGTGFGYSTALTFGGVAATSFIVIDDTQIQAVTPAHNAGPVDVVVTTGGGDSATGVNSTFTYVAPEPPDVPAGAAFHDEIMWLIGEGIATGWPDGTFRPTNSTTRQAMAAYLYRMAGSPDGEDPTCTTAPFVDVAVDSAFCGEITWLVDQGITTGWTDGTFRPTKAVTREAMAVFLYRLNGSPNGAHPTCSTAPFSDVPVSAAFCGEISWLAAEGISTGYPDGSFHPSESVSRQAMAAFLFRATNL
jgi:hypothetical protein